MTGVQTCALPILTVGRCRATGGSSTDQNRLRPKCVLLTPAAIVKPEDVQHLRIIAGSFEKDINEMTFSKTELNDVKIEWLGPTSPSAIRLSG